MKKQDFYIQALLGGAFRRKDWVISAFSVTRPQVDEEHSLTAYQLYTIRYNRDSTEVYVPTLGGDEWVTIEDSPPMQQLFFPGDPLTVTPEMIPNCKEPVESTYGDLLFNWIALVEPFGQRIDYQVGPVNIRKIERIIASRLVDDPEISGRELGENDIPIKMYMRYGRCMGALAGFTQVFVPTLSPKALTTDPRVRSVRDELLEKNKERLHDPVVVAGIQNELIAIDKEWIKDDPSEGFLISNKTFGTARKRMFLIHGPEAGFNEGGNAELVVNSLNEGWDTDKLVAMFNSTRAGSFYRGALTALGGEAVKFFMRVFQNTAVGEEDCGSTLGIERTVEPGQSDYYVGLWEIKSDKTSQVITPERAKALEGKKFMSRSPLFCKTGATDFCERCVGQALAAIPYALGAENVSVASKFMDIMMASAHAKELKTAKLNIHEAFT